MRNYVSLWFLKWQVTTDDGMGNQNQFFVYEVGEKEADLVTRVQAQEALIISGLPIGWTATFQYPFSAQNAFVCLDKTTIFNLAKTFQSTFYENGIAISDPTLQIVRTVLETPRYSGWKDADGVARKAAPSDKKAPRSDFSGAPGLITFVHNLPAYAALLKLEGRLRDAGIVLELYNQIITGRQSITDALAILRQNGL